MTHSVLMFKENERQDILTIAWNRHIIVAYAHAPFNTSYVVVSIHVQSSSGPEHCWKCLYQVQHCKRAAYSDTSDIGTQWLTKAHFYSMAYLHFARECLLGFGQHLALALLGTKTLPPPWVPRRLETLVLNVSVFITSRRPCSCDYASYHTLLLLLTAIRGGHQELLSRAGIYGLS